MIRSVLLVLCLLGVFHAHAQVVHGNEWVDHSRRHWRFNIVADGIYRIDSTTLANSGFPVATVDPAHLMLFAREQQVPIYVQDGGDGVFNADDFIEFHAQGNDGWLDAAMYPNPQQHTNPTYSLYNDTLRYFLTWDADAPKARVVPYTNTDFAAHPIRPWCWGEAQLSYNQLYQVGLGDPQFNATSGFYTEGEGWLRQPILQANSTNNGAEQAITVTTPRAFTGAGAPPMRLTTSSASLNNPGGVGFLDHHLILSYGPAPGVVLLDTIFGGVKVIRRNFELPVSSLGNNLIVRFTVPYDLFGPGLVGEGNPTGYIDRQAIAFIRLRYSRDFHFQNSSERTVWVPQVPGEPLAHLDFGNFVGTPVLYAWGDTVRRVLPTQSGNRWKALVPTHPTLQETQVVVRSAQTITPITTLVPVNGTGFFVDYRNLEADSALLIVTHASLMDGAQAYKQYREQQAPPTRRMPTVIAEVDDLYDQFGGGVPKSGFAIRRFAKFVLDNWATDRRACCSSASPCRPPRCPGYRATAPMAPLPRARPARRPMPFAWYRVSAIPAATPASPSACGSTPGWWRSPWAASAPPTVPR